MLTSQVVYLFIGGSLSVSGFEPKRLIRPLFCAPRSPGPAQAIDPMSSEVRGGKMDLKTLGQTWAVDPSGVWQSYSEKKQHDVDG